MKFFHYCIILCWTVGVITPKPVTQKKSDDNDKDSEIKEDLGEYMEYHRYLKEVVAALESDPEFRQKLEKADYVDIRTGKIAHELDFVNHNVRTKLDEIKRNELERLRHLAIKHFELTNNIDTTHMKIASQAEHLDHNNPNTFEIDDLKKLILKTTKDLDEADQKRRDEFKEYEMQKEFEKQQKLQTLDEEHKKEYEKEIHDKEEKHKKHDPLHHPGSRQQLEEVWEKQDHMENQQFDPKVFFMLHDVDGNGVWDQTEVKALFLKELDKMYENGAPEDDMRERQEEMERMREHVFHESDTNKDGLISYEEFLVQTRRSEFEKDQGWKGLDEQEVYSPQEYEEFERRRLEEVQRLIQQGVLPPQPIYDSHPYGNQLPHPAYQQNAQYQQYGQPQFHPNAIPQNQQFHQNMVQQPQQFHPNAIPPNQYHPNAVPQGQMHMNPPVQVHPGNQQGQAHPNVAPQINAGNPQGQFNPNAVPQTQHHPNNVPQGPGISPHDTHPQVKSNEVQNQQNINANSQQANHNQQPQQVQTQAQQPSVQQKSNENQTH